MVETMPKVTIYLPEYVYQKYRDLIDARIFSKYIVKLLLEKESISEIEKIQLEINEINQQIEVLQREKELKEMLLKKFQENDKPLKEVFFNALRTLEKQKPTVKEWFDNLRRKIATDEPVDFEAVGRVLSKEHDINIRKDYLIEYFKK